MVRNENSPLAEFFGKIGREFPEQFGFAPLAEMLYGYMLLRRQGGIDHEDSPMERNGLPFVQQETINAYFGELELLTQTNPDPGFLFNLYAKTGAYISQEKENPLYFLFMIERSISYPRYENTMLVRLVDIYSILREQAVKDRALKSLRN